MTDPDEELFAWGNVGRTLLGALLWDVAMASSQPDAGLAEGDVERLLSDPLCRGATDEVFLDRLLLDVREQESDATRRIPLRHAELAFGLARSGPPPTAQKFLRILLHRALTAEDTRAARAYARAGLGALAAGAPPDFLSACYDALGRSYYDEGDFAHALPAFQSGAEHSRSSGDQPGEWDRLTIAWYPAATTVPRELRTAFAAAG